MHASFCSRHLLIENFPNAGSRKQLAGSNSHHIVEATFKAFARALRQATEYDPRRRGSVPRFKFASLTSRNYVVVISFLKMDELIMNFLCLQL